jgi:hypothetical protein
MGSKVKALMIVNDRFPIIERHRAFKLPESEEDDVWKRFAEWAEAVKTRPSVVNTRSEEQHYEQV